MKRVKAACILQTLVFMQKEDCGLSQKSILETNRREFEHYKQTMDRTHTRYQIVSADEQEDGSIIVRWCKQTRTTQEWLNPLSENRGFSCPAAVKLFQGLKVPPYVVVSEERKPQHMVVKIQDSAL